MIVEDEFRDGLTCQYCGKHEPLRWIDSVRQKLIRQQACHTCGFWLDHAHRDSLEAADRDRYVVTDDWEHYLIGLEDAVGFRGFGGHKFVVEWYDPDRPDTTTTNLWCQGEIPENMRDRFTVNGRIRS